MYKPGGFHRPTGLVLSKFVLSWDTGSVKSFFTAEEGVASGSLVFDVTMYWLYTAIVVIIVGIYRIVSFLIGSLTDLRINRKSQHNSDRTMRSDSRWSGRDNP